MKSLKFVIINALTLIIGLGLMSGSISQKDAQPAHFEAIPSLKITQLGNYRGQYLTVLYAVGSRPLLADDENKISLSQVKDSRTAYITGDSLQLPSTQVEKEGFRPSYNMVLFVVSKQPNFSWINSDGRLPQGLTLTKNQQRSLIKSLNKSEIETFTKARGQKMAYVVRLNQQ